MNKEQSFKRTIVLMYFNVYWFVTEMQLKWKFGEILNVKWQAQPV